MRTFWQREKKLTYSKEKSNKELDELGIKTVDKKEVL